MGIDLKDLRAHKPDKILDYAKNDKKSKDGRLRYVILKEIGKIDTHGNKFAHHVEDKTVVRALKKITLKNNI